MRAHFLQYENSENVQKQHHIEYQPGKIPKEFLDYCFEVKTHTIHSFKKNSKLRSKK